MIERVRGRRNMEWVIWDAVVINISVHIWGVDCEG